MGIEQRNHANQSEVGPGELVKKWKPGMHLLLCQEFVGDFRGGEEMASNPGRILSVHGNYARIRWRKSLEWEIPIKDLGKKFSVVGE